MPKSSLVLHPATETLCAAYLKEPAHALLLEGDEGVGLATLARWLGSELSGNEKLVTMMEPEKGLISIDRVRRLYEQTKSIQQGRRVIVIDDADSMSVDAQNALLKLLEEPVENVHFILTSHVSEKLLPTIKSRVQHVRVQHTTDEQSRAVLDQFELTDTQKVQALFLASGRPAELTRLASDTDHLAARGTIVTDVRQFLQADTYTRLSVVKKYTDRTAALEFLDMCSKLLSFMMLKQKNYSAADSMEIVDTVSRRIAANGHVRTQMAYLVTKLI